MGLLSMGLRALRWKIILQFAGKIGFWQAFHPLMIGFMMNCVLPGRIGEIARPIVLYRKDKVPFSTGLATVAVERTFDTLLLIIFFAVVLTFVEIDPQLTISFGKYHLNRDTLMAISNSMIGLCVLLTFGIILFSMQKTRKLLAGMIQDSPSLFFFLNESKKQQLRDKITQPLVSALENFSIGFTFLKHPKTIFECFSLSLFIWTLAAFSYYLVMLGCPGIHLNFFEVTAVMVITSFFIALPSVPGYWGLWEAGGIFALYLFGIPAAEAGGCTLANHAIQILPVIIIGMISAAITGIKIRHISIDKNIYKKQSK